MDETGDHQTSQCIQLLETPSAKRHSFSYISEINRNKTQTAVTNICLNGPSQRIFLELLTTVPVADAISFFSPFFLYCTCNKFNKVK